jgi:hypothetical protein
MGKYKLLLGRSLVKLTRVISPLIGYHLRTYLNKQQIKRIIKEGYDAPEDFIEARTQQNTKAD